MSNHIGEVPEPVRSFLDKVNDHDDAGVLAAFTDDALVDDWGKQLRGRDAIGKWSDSEFVGSKPSLTITSVATDDGTVTVVGDWRSKHANGMSKFVFHTNGGKITSMEISEG